MISQKLRVFKDIFTFMQMNLQLFKSYKKQHLIFKRTFAINRRYKKAMVAVSSTEHSAKPTDTDFQQQ